MRDFSVGHFLRHEQAMANQDAKAVAVKRALQILPLELHLFGPSRVSIMHTLAIAGDDSRMCDI